MLNWLGEKLARFLGEEVDTSFASPVNESASDFLYHSSISEILPYFAYDDEYKLFINKRSYGFCFEMSPMIGFSEKVERELEGIFKTIMPLGSNLQFLLFASPKVGNKLDFWEKARSGTNDILRYIAKNRADYFRKFAHSSSKVRDFRVFVSVSFELKNYLTRVMKKEAKDLQDAITSVFEAVELSCCMMNPEALMSLINSIVAYKKDLHYKNLKWNELDTIDKQVSYPDTSLQIKKNDLIIDEGEVCIRNYIATQLPERWYLGAMDVLIGDNDRDTLQIECPFLISYGVHIEEDNFLQAKLLAKGGRVESQAATPLVKWFPGLVREAFEWRTFREQMQKKHKIVRTCYQITLFSCPENITKDEQKLMSLYRSNEFELVRQRFTNLYSFVSTFPMSWGDGMCHDMTLLKQTDIRNTTVPVNFLPIIGEWKGTKMPGVLLTSKKGQVFTWSPFDSNGNYNVAVVGQPGKGKSFTTQVLLESILSLGGRAFVLDLGRSYEKFCNRVGGNHLVFSSSSDLCLNPFSRIPTSFDKQARNSRRDALLTIKSIVALMAAPTKGVSDLEYSYIEKAINKAWHNKQTKTTITDVIIELEKINDTRTKDLSVMLYPYGDGGSYGQFFEGEANIDFNNYFNTIELEELKATEDLQAVVFQTLTLQITNSMFLGDRKTPWVMVMEEFWDLLKNARAVDFAERTNRLIRRFYGSLVAVTQNIGDFYKNDGSRAVFENSEWLCMLSQKADSIAQLRKSEKFKINEHEEYILSSLRTVSGKYAEMMIKSDEGYAVGRLMVDPFSRILYSSKAQEFSRVKDLQKQGLSLSDAISQTASEVFGNDAV